MLLSFDKNSKKLVKTKKWHELKPGMCVESVKNLEIGDFFIIFAVERGFVCRYRRLPHARDLKILIP